MLYPKSKTKELDRSLFQNPSCEYRGTPFWAWNSKLEPDLLLRQIGYLKEMGFGGFHMHSRTGMALPYLGEEFMARVALCIEKARKEEMLAWLYDEDRWPSGAAGGLVTKNPEYRARHLLFTPNPYQNKNTGEGRKIEASCGQRMENGVLLGSYEISLNTDGTMAGYRRLVEGERGTGENTWYAYLEISGTSPWFNNQTYVNTLDKKAVDEFIHITYESYKKTAGKDFGGIVPAIFTDEPQFTRKTTLGFATDRTDVYLPWTDDLPSTYLKEYGEALLDHLPELFWDLEYEKPSTVRYHYHDHIAGRFAEAFANNCGAWCRKNNLMLTGHMMEEPTLESQTAALGEAMRSYSGFDLPGIDMLCDQREYTTAKQAQSAAHQYGCEGVLSELYGVTNWDFDFRGHKLQGDWQAALGITVRVPHLSWVSMEGEAKRDYPASISYQSPWFREYPLIENHFARINTAMTRGKPLVRIGVIHPVESYWLHWGPREQTAALRAQLDENFNNITDWLLFSQLDFDFICESTLPDLCAEGGAPLQVGEMKYDTLVIPGCETLRSSTVKRLEGFLRQGGNLVIMGKTPQLVDACPQCGQLDFLTSAQNIPYEKAALLSLLEPARELEIRNSGGTRTEHLLSSIRSEGENRWLFIANGRKEHHPDVSIPQKLTIRLAGRWIPEIYDTLTGEIRTIPFVFEKSRTVIEQITYQHDSLLFCLRPEQCGQPETYGSGDVTGKGIIPPEGGFSTDCREISINNAEGFLPRVPVELSEPNVLLLDLAEYAFDNGDFAPQEEILRIDNRFREQLGLPTRMAVVAQPWTLEPEKTEHSIRLRFAIQSEINISGVSLALENARETRIRFNGIPVKSTSCGWFTDEAIQTVRLPEIIQGENILELDMPFGKRTNLEWCYLLGDFGVQVNGFEKIITAPVRELAFGDIVHQGLPFYGGNIHYKMKVEGRGGPVQIQTSAYRGAMVGITLDGKRIGSIVFEPYTFRIPMLSEGEHEIGLILFGNRVNTFGAVHNCDSTFTWHGPDAWRSAGDRWSYEYILKKTGILKSPGVAIM